jgi:hypothetical protein
LAIPPPAHEPADATGDTACDSPDTDTAGATRAADRAYATGTAGAARTADAAQAARPARTAADASCDSTGFPVLALGFFICQNCAK